jgi:hypothetical protein
VLKVFVEQVRNQTQHIRQVAFFDLVLEIGNDNAAEILAHDSFCFPPTNRKKAGCSSLSIMRLTNVMPIKSFVRPRRKNHCATG